MSSSEAAVDRERAGTRDVRTTAVSGVTTRAAPADASSRQTLTCPLSSHPLSSLESRAQAKDTTKGRRKLLANRTFLKTISMARCFELSDGDKMPFHVTDGFFSRADFDLRRSAVDDAS